MQREGDLDKLIIGDYDHIKGVQVVGDEDDIDDKEESGDAFREDLGLAKYINEDEEPEEANGPRNQPEFRNDGTVYRPNPGNADDPDLYNFDD